MKRHVATLFLMAASLFASAAASAQTAPPPLPNPDAHGLYHMDKDVTGPTILEQLQWKPPLNGNYSDQLRCVVAYIVTSDGITSNIQVKRCIVPGHKTGESDEFDSFTAALARSAYENVALIRFHPARFKGTPVPVAMAVELNMSSVAAP